MDQIMYYRTETKLIVVHAEVTGVCGDGNLSCDDCHSAENARKIIIKELSKRAIDITEIPENYMYIPAAHLSRICKATKAGAMFRLQIEEFHNGHGGKRAKPGRKPMKEEEKRKNSQGENE